MIHRSQQQRHIKVTVGKTGKNQCVPLQHCDGFAAVEFLPQNFDIMFDQLNRRNVESFFSKRDTVPSRPRTDLKNTLRINRVCAGMDVLLCCNVFDLPGF